jgi:hypothetical protein
MLTLISPIRRVVAAGFAAMLLLTPGCQSESRPAPTRPSARGEAGDTRDSAAGVMAEDDTERAKQAAIENRNRSRPGRPVTEERTGSSVVDQPRVGGRP